MRPAKSNCNAVRYQARKLLSRDLAGHRIQLVHNAEPHLGAAGEALLGVSTACLLEPLGRIPNLAGR